MRALHEHRQAGTLFDDGTGFHLQFVSKIGVSPSEPDRTQSTRFVLEALHPKISFQSADQWRS
jgi:hypothetical protein